MPAYITQGGNNGTWATDLRTFWTPIVDLSTGAFNLSQSLLFSGDGAVDIGAPTKRARNIYASGQVSAGTYTGDGSGLTGIASGTGGVINTGSTTIGADSDSTGGGEIAFQVKGVTKMTLNNAGKLALPEIQGNITLGSTAGGVVAITTQATPGSIASPINIDLDFIGYLDYTGARIRSWDESSNTTKGYLSFWTNSNKTAGNGNLAERMRITDTGNVGIGTLPAHALDVFATGTAVIRCKGDLNPNIRVEDSTNSVFSKIQSLDSNGIVGTESNHDLHIIANNNAKMAVTTSGSVSIGGLAPNANSLLDLTSTTKAFMPPRMTTTQRDAIVSPTKGMMIYNITTNVPDHYNGTSWGAV